MDFPIQTLEMLGPDHVVSASADLAGVPRLDRRPRITLLGFDLPNRHTAAMEGFHYYLSKQ